jgi:hypothetical protein
MYFLEDQLRCDILASFYRFVLKSDLRLVVTRKSSILAEKRLEVGEDLRSVEQLGI